MGVPPVIMHFSGIVPYQPTILGVPQPFWGYPHGELETLSQGDDSGSPGGHGAMLPSSNSDSFLDPNKEDVDGRWSTFRPANGSMI